MRYKRSFDEDWDELVDQILRDAEEHDLRLQKAGVVQELRDTSGKVWYRLDRPKMVTGLVFYVYWWDESGTPWRGNVGKRRLVRLLNKLRRIPA